MVVSFNNLKAQWDVIKPECVNGIHKLFEKSDFILGEEVSEFEEAFAAYAGCNYAVGVSNGTDALKLSAQSLNLEGTVGVVIPANTFVSTIFGVEQALPHASFALVDCNEHYQLDTRKLHQYLKNNREKYQHLIIVPVHLFGYTCNMDEIIELAMQYDCIILEDASQAHGATWNSSPVGSMGEVAAFSLYPGKNLGAAGDAGIITTNDKDTYDRLLMLRNVGSVEKYKHEVKGSNHRLDTIQAIILNQKIKHLDEWNQMRKNIVSIYELEINETQLSLPRTPEGCDPVHHVYPVRVNDRDRFMDHLTRHGIQHGIHYPICIEEMPMYKHLSVPNENALRYSNEMVSLPIHPFMSEDEAGYVCEVVNKY